MSDPAVSSAVPPRDTVLSPWAPLRLPVFRALWIATVISNVGSWMQNVAAGWLMTSLAPDPLMVSLIQAATSLPMFLLALPAGVLADIVDRRRFMIFSQTGMALVAGALALVTIAGQTTAWTLLLFTFLLGCGAALLAPAWQAIVPELVPRSYLPNAIAMNSVGINLSRAVGPAVGGALVASFGAGIAFGVNSVSFLAIIAVLLWWKPPAEDSSGDLPPEHFFGAMRSGIRYARHAPALHSVLIRAGVFLLFASSSWALLPIVAKQQLGGGPYAYGILLASIGAGAVCGALLLPTILKPLSPNSLVAVAGVLFAVATVALGSLRSLPLLVPFMLLLGSCWMFALSSLSTAAQTSLPRWVRARALGVYLIVFFGAMSGGSALWGQVASKTSISTSLWTSAALLAVSSLATIGFHISRNEQLNLSPSQHWPLPLNVEVEPHRGPVLVLARYRVPVANAAEFQRLMRELRRSRERDGAILWGLFEAMEEPGVYIETFQAESWMEHLRHHERVTVDEQALERRIRALLEPDTVPEVTHSLHVCEGRRVS
ncbi:MAG: MFS transporter [Acidobacteria bacterium]|nr:MFS transporter [Acidobacteriota bacterium]